MTRSPNAPGKITPAIARRIFQLASTGLSQRAIAERLEVEGLGSVSHMAVGRTLKRSPVRAPTPATATPGRALHAPSAPASPPPSPEAVDDFIRATTAEVLQLEQLDDAAPGTIEHLRLRQRQIGKIADALVPDIRRGTYPATQWKQLVALEQDLAQRIMRLVPPEMPAPETDPYNVETRDGIVGRLEQVVSELEGDPLIRECMRRTLDNLDAMAGNTESRALKSQVDSGNARINNHCPMDFQT